MIWKAKMAPHWEIVMKRLILIATFFLVVLSGLGARAENKDKPTELDGKWKVVKEINDGKEMPGLFVNTIKGQTHTITWEGKVVAVQRAQIDSSKNPKTIDLEFIKRTRGGGLKYWRGIYALDGDELKLCFREGKDWPDEKDRPTQFLSKPGSSVSLIVLRRVRADYQERGLTPSLADAVYGRKDGLALTLDVFHPANRANGAAVVWVLSGGFITQTTADPGFVAFRDVLLARGYTVIAVRHGSQPRYTVPEIVDDVHRAVRFIRSQAANWKLDPDRIGISGHSSGGYLSLFVGVTGDQGKPGDEDPVERLPSRVGAVASFCPPTDFLAFRQFTRDTVPSDIRAAFDFRRFDEAKGIFVPIREESAYQEMIRQLSPAQRVTKDAAPTLILQGDKDELLPVQQAEQMIEKLKAVGVPGELVIKKGVGHHWNLEEDGPRVADWFDRLLAKPKLEKR
jgi:uncharacterized protein (TIGR03067 family)